MSSLLFPLNPIETPLVLLAEGCFGEHHSKTATGVLQFGQWPVVAVIDSTRAGKTVREITGIPNDAPVIASVKEAAGLGAKALMIGTAPTGGALPDDWKILLLDALEHGMHLISGLHTFLSMDPVLSAKAQAKNPIIWDVRDTPQESVICRQLPRPVETRVITMVGSDCCVGKMYSALLLTQAARVPASFLATGQTGMMISGRGIPLDRVIGDFMAGYTERAIQEVIHTDAPHWVFVEGQGSLLHPAYSSVTLALLHGSAPDAMILCHKAGLTHIEHYPIPIPPLKEVIAMYETAARWIKPAKIVGISLNCASYSDADARGFVEKTQQETGLPTTDPLRFGPEPLITALEIALR